MAVISCGVSHVSGALWSQPPPPPAPDELLLDALLLLDAPLLLDACDDEDEADDDASLAGPAPAPPPPEVAPPLGEENVAATSVPLPQAAASAAPANKRSMPQKGRMSPVYSRHATFLPPARPRGRRDRLHPQRDRHPDPAPVRPLRGHRLPG